MQDVGSSSSALLVSQIIFVISDTAAGPHKDAGSVLRETGVVCGGEVLRSSTALSLLNYRYEDAGLDVVGPRRRLRWSSQPKASSRSTIPYLLPSPQSLLPFHLLIRRL
jgi:hypothetical protein